MCEEPPLAIDRILISQFENESSRVLILQIARRRNIDRLSQVFFIIVLSAKILFFKNAPPIQSTMLSVTARALLGTYF